MDHSAHAAGSPDSLALRATIHCLTGCAIGEVLGLVLGTALGWPNATTILIAVLLAFLTGFAFTMWPLIGAGFGFRRAAGLAFVADAASRSTAT